MNLAIVERIESIAKRIPCSAAQIALAWLLAQGQDIVPIPGTKRRAHLEEDLGALAVRLTPEDLAALDEAAPPGAASGLRYPEAAMRSVNR
jgi:aryl-alcohol dehydrogenase-like predicted oxidoreductase